MSLAKTGWRAAGLIVALLLSCLAAQAQIPIPGREHVEIKRLRPAEVHLAHSTLSVRVRADDPAAAHLVGRLKRIIANGVIGANRNRTLREVEQGGQVQIECSITRYYRDEKVEDKKLLMVKEKGRFRIINAMLEVSYKVFRAKENSVYFANNFGAPFKGDFQEGIQTAPGKSEIEDRLMAQVVQSILTKLTDTEETLKVRLMGKGDLSRFARLAQGKQWLPYIESITSLRQEKTGKSGKSEFEGDAYYNMGVAYEALFYEQMWNDYSQAEQYHDKADELIRKAQRTDPREKEYVNAQARLLAGKQFFDKIKERFPKQPVVAGRGSQSGPRSEQPANPNAPAGSLTNEDVVTLVKGGISEELVIGQIREAKVKRFDTSPAALVKLKNAGVSEEIIKAILEAAKPAAPTRRRK